MVGRFLVLRLVVNVLEPPLDLLRRYDGQHNGVVGVKKKYSPLCASLTLEFRIRKRAELAQKVRDSDLSKAVSAPDREHYRRRSQGILEWVPC